MSLSAGTWLGSYEIIGQIGAGGMGEVYRARDTKLEREVAIKTLPAALAADKDRLARFEREAKLLASLNHGHIASVYGLDEHEGTLYIAMELVEGETPSPGGSSRARPTAPGRPSSSTRPATKSGPMPGRPTAKFWSAPGRTQHRTRPVSISRC